MYMYKWFGILNIILIVAATSQYWVRRLNQWFFHSGGANYKKLMKTLRVLHKPLGALLLASIAVHGWLALGAFRLHTGTVAGLVFYLAALFGLLFFLLRKPPLLKWHRALALAAVLLTVLHLLFPALLNRLS